MKMYIRVRVRAFLHAHARVCLCFVVKLDKYKWIHHWGIKYESNLLKNTSYWMVWPNDDGDTHARYVT